MQKILSLGAEYFPRPSNGMTLRLWAGAAPGATGDNETDIPTLTPIFAAR